MSQIIPAILHETDANNHVMLDGQCYYSCFMDCQESDFALFRMSKRTSLDLKDAAYIHIVHSLQYPTSRPTTKSTKTTMVNAPTQNFSPALSGRYGNRRRAQPNDVIKRMKARSAWWQGETEPLGHCAA